MEKERNRYKAQHSTSSVWRGEGNGMEWAYMVATWIMSRMFTDDLAPDKSSAVNSEVYRAIITVNQNILQNLVWQFL